MLTTPPYGIEVATALPDDQGGFTGHIKDSTTGLNYMQARYYDPVMGRFLSIDPVTFLDTGETGMFNRYSYTLNDPINFIDPFGEQACEATGGGEGETCFESSNYKPEKVSDGRTITQSQDLTDAINASAGWYETRGYDEDVFELEDTEAGVSMRQNTTDETNKKLETSFTPSGGKIDAIMHTHPTDKSNAASGPGDDKAVKALGVPNNITHGSGYNITAGHVGMVEGQFYYRVTRGKLSSTERKNTKAHLKQYQRRNQK